MSRNPETVTCEMNIEHVPRVPIVIVSSLSRKCCPPSDLVCAENSYSSMSSTNFHSPLVQPGGLSEKSRTLSANTLRDRLSKLATPLNPVAALHANIKCVFFIARYYLSYQIDLFYFISFFILQFRPGTNTEETEAADACGCCVVCDDSHNNMCMAPVMVCLPFFWDFVLHSTLSRSLL